MPNSIQPLAPCYPMFTYLENQLLCTWRRIPIHSCPWSVNNCPTLCKFSHPFTPHRSSYNIYIDDINNTSHPRLAHQRLAVFSICLSFRWTLPFSTVYSCIVWEFNILNNMQVFSKTTYVFLFWYCFPNSFQYKPVIKSVCT
jgi:hypothetical protein